MSVNWNQDIKDMHQKFGHSAWVEKHKGDPEIMSKLLEFRMKFMAEESQELADAYENNDTEEIVDALIDLCVVAIGTLDLFDVDAQKAWDEVLKANMSKEPGVKPNRPNPLGLPDLMKPEGWVGPSHEGNHGVM